jgi:hypothetical protein
VTHSRFASVSRECAGRLSAHLEVPRGRSAYCRGLRAECHTCNRGRSAKGREARAECRARGAAGTECPELGLASYLQAEFPAGAGGVPARDGEGSGGGVRTSGVCGRSAPRLGRSARESPGGVPTTAGGVPATRGVGRSAECPPPSARAGAECPQRGVVRNWAELSPLALHTLAFALVSRECAGRLSAHLEVPRGAVPTAGACGRSACTCRAPTSGTRPLTPGTTADATRPHTSFPPAAPRHVRRTSATRPRSLLASSLPPARKVSTCSTSSGLNTTAVRLALPGRGERPRGGTPCRRGSRWCGCWCWCWCGPCCYPRRARVRGLTTRLRSHRTRACRLALQRTQSTGQQLLLGPVSTRRSSTEILTVRTCTAPPFLSLPPLSSGPLFLHPLSLPPRSPSPPRRCWCWC